MLLNTAFLINQTTNNFNQINLLNKSSLSNTETYQRFLKGARGHIDAKYSTCALLISLVKAC